VLPAQPTVAAVDVAVSMTTKVLKLDENREPEVSRYSTVLNGDELWLQQFDEPEASCTRLI
jgi:hypothetical protein